MDNKIEKILTFLGLVILAAFLFAAFFPNVLAPYGEKEMFEPWLKPSSSHLLGTNRLGYDVLTELIHGTADTLITGLSASVLSLFLGAFLGALGAEENWLGKLSNGCMNVMAMMPRLLVLIVLSSFLKGGRWMLVFLISLFSWSMTAKAVRARVRHLKQELFMESLKVQGFSRMHILFFHTIPNLSDVLLSRFLLGVNSAIMMESTLSFLGFGDVYHPTWGTMVNLAYKNGAFMRRAYNYLVSPGICIMLLSLSFYMLSILLQKRRETIEEA